MVDQLYPEISKKDFEKILKKIAINEQKEDRKTLEQELNSQGDIKESTLENKETSHFIEENKENLNLPKETPDSEVEKKVSQIEKKAVSLIIAHLRKKGYSEDFVKKNIDLIEDAVYDILYM